MSQRKRYTSQFKAKVAFEAIKNHKTIAQIASDYSIVPNQVSSWKKQLLDSANEIFIDPRKKSVTDQDQLLDELYRQIGQLKVELDWVKKNLNSSIEQKRALVERELDQISVSRQCQLLGLRTGTTRKRL